MQSSAFQVYLIMILAAAQTAFGKPTSSTPENRSCAYENCIRPTEVPPRARPTISKFCESVLKTTPTTSTVTTTEETIVVITPPTATVTVTSTVTSHRQTATATTTNAAVEAAPQRMPRAPRAAARKPHILATTVTDEHPRSSRMSNSPTVTTTMSDIGAMTTTTITTTITPPSEPSPGSNADLELKIRDDTQAQPTSYPSELVKNCKTTSPAVTKFSSVCSCFLTTPTVTSTTTVTQTGTLKTSTTTITKTVTVTQMV